MGYKPKFEVGSNAVSEIPQEHQKWEINDNFGHVVATDIYQYGIKTPYRMVYREVQNRSLDEKIWTPIGSVGEGWEPMPTQPIVDMVQERLTSAGLLDADSGYSVKVPKFHQKATMHRIDFTLNKAVEIPIRGRDIGTSFAPKTPDGTPEVYCPRVTLWNGYSGSCSLRAGMSIFRQVCSNGLVIQRFLGTCHNLHTRSSVGQFLNKISKMNFLENVAGITEFLVKADAKELTEEEIKSLKLGFSQKDAETWASFPDKSANGLINFLSYRQTHQASVTNEAKYQRMINMVVKTVAA